MLTSGTAVRSAAMRSRYWDAVYPRRMAASTRSEPAWAGRCTCSHTLASPATAAMRSSPRSLGCDVMKRMRSSPGMPSRLARSAGEARRVRLSPRRRSRPYALTFWPSSVTSTDPVRDQRLGLGDDLVDRSAALGPAHVGHDAVRAEVGAAAHDLHPRLERSLTARLEAAAEVWAVLEEAGRDCVRRLDRGLQQLRQPVQVLGAERAVHEREAREEVGLFGLWQASGDQHDASGVLALEPRRGAQVAGQAIVGALAHRAGVVHEHVRVVGLLRALQALGLEQRADALGVVLVHLAAERAEVVAARHDALVAVRGRRGCAAPLTWRCRRRGSRG